MLEMTPDLSNFQRMSPYLFLKYLWLVRWPRLIMLRGQKFYYTEYLILVLIYIKHKHLEQFILGELKSK